MTKLFIGGVSPSTTGETIQSFFSRFGPVADAVVMRDRGFGFVTFEDQASADAALAEPHQNIDGQTVDVKPAVGKGGRDGGGGRGGGKGGGGSGPATDKVFVGGLPQDCSDEKIRDYFGVYGTITDAVVMKDRETGRSRGFGFVQFDGTEPVEKVMAEYSNHKIEGKWVEVKRSVPRDQMPPGGSSGGGRGDRGGDRRGGGGGRDRDRDYGDSRGPSPYGGGYPAYPGAYGGGYPGYGGGYPSYPPPAYGGYPGYPPPAAGYPGYDPYAAYGGYSGYGAAPPAGKGGSRPAPY